MDKPNKTPCIRDMCCNQFGERDEMQRIINSLQADVIARGARIAVLERELQLSLERFELLVGIEYSEAVNSGNTEECETAKKILNIISNFKKCGEVELSDA